MIAGAGSAAGGLLSQGLLRLRLSLTKARKAAVTIACVMMAMAVLAVRAHSLVLCFGYVSIAMAGYTVALANMLPMPADVFPSESVASVYGLASMGSGFGGMVFMLITGWVVQHHSYNLAFLLFAVLPFLGIGIQWLFMGPLNHAHTLIQEEAPTAL